MNCLAVVKDKLCNHVILKKKKNKGKHLEGRKKAKNQTFAKILCKFLKHISCCYVPA